MSNYCPVTSDLDYYLDQCDYDDAQAEAEADPDLDCLAGLLPFDIGMTLEDWEAVNDE